MKKSDAAHMWVKLLLGLIYVAILVAFAVQTWDLVNWLFPSDQMWMKLVTVFSFDGTAALYTLLDMFYRFRNNTSRNVIKGMWYLSFGLSTIATVLEMYMASAGRLSVTYNPDAIRASYAFVILAFVANIIALTIFIRAEYAAFEAGIPPLDEQRKSVLTGNRPMPPMNGPRQGVPSPLAAPQAQNGNN